MNAFFTEEVECNIPPHLLFNELKGLPYSFFLDSAVTSKDQGGFSFLGCEPFLIFKSKRDSVTLEWNDGRVERLREDPFSVLKDLFLKFAVCPGPGRESGIPFMAGGVGYFGYDLKCFIEKLPDISKDDLSIPDCVIGFYDTVLAYDHTAGKSYLAGAEFKGIRTGARTKLKKALSSKA